MRNKDILIMLKVQKRRMRGSPLKIQKTDQSKKMNLKD